MVRKQRYKLPPWWSTEVEEAWREKIKGAAIWQKARKDRLGKICSM